MSENQIDPILFGRVLARLDKQDEEILALREDVKTLVNLANQGKGGLLMLTTIGTVVGTIIGWLGAHIFK